MRLSLQLTFAMLVLAAVSILLLADPAEAEVRTPFEPRFSTDANGDIDYVSNTLMTCPNTAGNCAQARNQPGFANNNFDMVYVDVDDNPATFNSSRADFTLPDGGEVLFAGLYWGARSEAPTRNQVLFSTPGTAAYQPIGGEVVGAFGTGNGPEAYHAFADVTGQVQAAGSGTYGVANVQSTQGRDQYAGWSLVVVYADPQAPPRNLTVFDGFADVRNNADDRQVDIEVSGFTTPPQGPVNADVGAIAYEGDGGLSGDALRLRGGDTGGFTTLADDCSPGGNFFNSSICRFGQPVNDTNPDYANQLGYDANILEADGIIPNGATNATVRLSTGGDTYYPAVITTAIELFSPDVRVDKDVRDVNGGDVLPGDELEYTVTATNQGQDAAVNTILRDAIPENTAYEPGTLQVVEGANAGEKTDTPGDDQAEYEAAQDRVNFRVGQGADATNGGRLAAAGEGGNSTTVSFRVRVDDGVAGGTTITNQATASYQGATLGRDNTANSPPAEVTVAPTADLAIAKQGPATVTDGDGFDYTLTVTNNGPSDAAGVIVRDTLPEGVEFVREGTDERCEAPNENGVVVCDLGTVDADAQDTLTIRVRATTLGQKTNAASVGSDTPDQNPDNNNDDATTLIAAAADLSIEKTGPRGSLAIGDRFTFTLTVTNNGPSPATGVTVTDRLPEGLQFVSSEDCDYAGDTRTVTCEVATVPPTGPNNQRTFEITVRTNQSGEATNTARVSGNEPDPRANNNSDSFTVSTSRCADLSIRVNAPNKVKVGDRFPYKIAVTNRGPDTSEDVKLKSVLPKAVSFVKASQGCKYNRASRTVTCGLGDVAAGSTKQRNIVVKAERAGDVRLRSCAVRSTTPSCDAPTNRAAQTTASSTTDGSDFVAESVESNDLPETTIVEPATPGDDTPVGQDN